MKKIFLSAIIISLSGIISYAQNIKAAKGNFSSLTVSGNTAATFDSIHVFNRVKVGNSIVIDAPNNSIYTTSTLPTNLLIQSQASPSDFNTIINANNTGKVGIGNQTTPDGKLSIFLDGAFTSLSPGSENTRVVVKNGLRGLVLGGEANGGLIQGIDPAMGVRNLQMQSFGGNVGIGIFTAPGSTLSVLGSVAIGDLTYAQFFTPPSEGLLVKGKVGFGTTSLSPEIQFEVKGSVSIRDGSGNTSLFFGREQTSLQAPATDFGEWGVQYWAGSGPFGNGTGRGGLNFWKPSGSDGIFGNGLLFLADDGQVGVGTYTPIQKLDVNGKINLTGGVIQQGGSAITTTSDLGLYSLAGLHMRFVTNNAPFRFFSDGGTIPAGGTELFSIEPNGNVRLNEHDIKFRSGFPDGNHGIGWYGDDPGVPITKLFATTNVNGPVVYGFDGGALGSKQSSTENIALRWDANGKVRIGTTTLSPDAPHNDYLLAVYGKIVGAKLVSTDPTLHWHDDEFKKETTLEDLEKEEQFTKENSHLRSVPSEKDIKVNGIDMGEMFSTQMLKIEQLYKYSFKFNHAVKQIDDNILQIQAENVSLRKDNEELKKSLIALQNQISELNRKIDLILKK